MWTLKQQQLLRGGTSLQSTSHTVTVTQEFGIDFQVSVAKFTPQIGDTTSYQWHDGTTERHLDMPPYYICDVEGAAKSMQMAAVKGKEASTNLLLRNANPILRKTVEAAYKYLKTSEVCSCKPMPNNIRQSHDLQTACPISRVH